MNPDQLRVLGKMMNVINPYGGQNPFGNCIACSIVAARALVDGDEMVSLDACRWELTRYYRDSTWIDEGEDRAQRTWNWLTGHTHPGGVFILSDEDHTFNILRDYDGALHLLDSNQQVYRTLNGLRDCDVPLLDPDTQRMTVYNRLGPGEGPLRIFHAGDLLRGFQAVAPPLRLRAASTPGPPPVPPSRRKSAP
jgi:hypothetical protein